MHVVLTNKIRDLGLSRDDVAHMLRAVDEHRRLQYEPSLEEIASLLTKAIAAEKARNRTVTAWQKAFDNLIKENV